ncbi:MAG TPA: sugar phosphate isomerase/epimerase [Candidatus Gallimonas intestinigallinarum]|uniref:Sugar phosphate isomerase/epimerase n=1 Tax=Candidatus Gallimonas intestinigallinarum TaxID=2838604 RepID=A0A9D2IVF2_9FIRM|nr:sugar phosphate isomerase/epimerase [Candidatus Gallimonas intestinigallinarum]
MKVGISTASLFLRKNNEEALPLFDAWGVPCAEVFLTSFCEYAPAFAHTLAAAKGGVEIHSVHVLNTQYEPQLYAEHPRVLEDANGWLREVLSSANILGARNYTFHGIARLKRTFRENWQRFSAITAQIYETCRAAGVRLCYENVEWALYNRPGLFALLKKDCPDLGGVLDIKQARITGYDWREYLADMGESLATVHVSDVTAEGKMCLPGQGVFEFAELFARLRGIGFDGAVLIENYARDYGEPDELRRSFEYLADLAAKR